MDQSGFNELINKYILGELNAPEQAKLLEMLDNPAYQQELETFLQDQFESSIKEIPPEPVGFAIQRLLHNRMPGHQFWEEEAVPITHKPAAQRKWWTAAAALFIVLGAGLLWYFMANSGKQPEIVQSTPVIQPGKNGAILLIDNGQEIMLDSMGEGRITQTNGTEVSIQNGRLVYAPENNRTSITSYNTLLTPPGRQFQVSLPDGTQVWLNAESSIKYPTVFKAKTRTVEITGEVYFEVHPNAEKPFIVRKNEVEIVVLGTYFNVNAYPELESVKVTLLEGSVQVASSGKSQATLEPGQQARLGSTVLIEDDVDISAVMAWKNGFFNFDGIGLEELMFQISRWYNIEVIYENGIPSIEFVGKMDRNTTLNDLLESLQAVGVTFTINKNNKLIIKQ